MHLTLLTSFHTAHLYIPTQYIPVHNLYLQLTILTSPHPDHLTMATQYIPAHNIYLQFHSHTCSSNHYQNTTV